MLRNHAAMSPAAEVQETPLGPRAAPVPVQRCEDRGAPEYSPQAPRSARRFPLPELLARKADEKAPAALPHAVPGPVADPGVLEPGIDAPEPAREIEAAPQVQAGLPHRVAPQLLRPGVAA